MSFSSDCKKECTLFEPEKSCCLLSELCGIYCGCGNLSLLGRGRFNASFSTGNMAVGRRAFQLLKSSLNITPQIHYRTSARFGGVRSCVLTLGPIETPKLMRAFHMLQEEEGLFRSPVPKLSLSRLCCKKAYLRGLFIAGGTVSQPGKDPHLELKATDDSERDMTARALQSLDIPVHISERRKGACFYMKQWEQITAFLGAIGAAASVLQMEELHLRAEIYHKTRRIVLCDESNLRRQLSAAEKQTRLIAAAKERGELNALPAALYEIALARLDNPEADLTELGKRMTPPLTKSAVNHRLRRLMQYLEGDLGC